MHLPSATAPLFCPAHRRKSAQAGGTGSEYWLPGHDPHNLALPVALPQKILDVRARVSLLLLRTLRPPSAAVISPAIVEGTGPRNPAFAGNGAGCFSWINLDAVSISLRGSLVNGCNNNSELLSA